jgi:hypothetical protein
MIYYILVNTSTTIKIYNSQLYLCFTKDCNSIYSNELIALALREPPNNIIYYNQQRKPIEKYSLCINYIRC